MRSQWHVRNKHLLVLGGGAARIIISGSSSSSSSISSSSSSSSVSSSSSSTASDPNSYVFSIPANHEDSNGNVVRWCNTPITDVNLGAVSQFFGSAITNEVTPVTVCLGQQIGPTGALEIRFIMEYEENGGVWYYDSAEQNDPNTGENYEKLLSYTGGGSSSNVDVLFMDGQGFIESVGNQNLDGSYTVSISFGDRPSYQAAINYDQQNGTHTAATINDLSQCQTDSGLMARLLDGEYCSATLVVPYSWYDTFLTTDSNLFMANKVAFAQQYTQNQFPAEMSALGVHWGSFGEADLSGL